LEKSVYSAAHRLGISKVGVFKQLSKQADAGQKVYVFIPFKVAWMLSLHLRKSSERIKISD